MNHVWVVERLGLWCGLRTWLPSRITFRTRKEAREYKNGIRKERSDAGYEAIGQRVRKYVRVED